MQILFLPEPDRKIQQYFQADGKARSPALPAVFHILKIMFQVFYHQPGRPGLSGHPSARQARLMTWLSNPGRPVFLCGTPAPGCPARSGCDPRLQALGLPGTPCAGHSSFLPPPLVGGGWGEGELFLLCGQAPGS